MRDEKFKVYITDAKYPSYELERSTLMKLDAKLIKLHCKTENDVIVNCKDADALLTHHAPITRKVVESLKKVKIIARYGVGVDNVDLEAATERGVFVTNVMYSLYDVADHTVALILSLIRKIPWIYQSTKAGEWNWRKFQPIMRIKGMTVGIIGFGKVGRELSKRIKGFGVKVIVYDPYLPLEVFKINHVDRVNFETIIEKSDIITLHTILTKETHHMIGKEELRKMKRTAILVNTCRGGIIDEKALRIALKEKWIAGAGLDVLEEELIHIKDNSLLEMDNLIITPHIAWYSTDSLPEIQTTAVEEVARVLRGELPLGIVNKGVMKRKSS